jgi:hypothetical protein
MWTLRYLAARRERRPGLWAGSGPQTPVDDAQGPGYELACALRWLGFHGVGGSDDSARLAKIVRSKGRAL